MTSSAIRSALRILFIGLTVTGAPQSAQAQLSIEGDSRNLVVVANNVPLGEVLDQLGQKLRVNVKSNLPRDISMNGRFSGTLDDVLRRLFEGYDFVAARRQVDGSLAIEIIVLGRSNSRSSPAPSRRAPSSFDGLK